MILSRTLARARIARKERPGILAAWLPVLFDACTLFAAGLAVWPMIAALTADLSVPLTIAILFAVYFVPVQAVLITASLWATRSRWDDTETTA